jgi:6-phosphofructokinase
MEAIPIDHGGQSMKKRMLYAQGGGPTAVINASLVGVLLEARKAGVEPMIAVGGIEGVLEQRFYSLADLSRQDMLALGDTPGAGAGSCRYKLTKKDYPKLAEVLAKQKIDYFFYNGGNDSMATCHKVSQLAGETRVIGIAKTIDNDLALTDHCPGFGSAARYNAITVRELGLDVRSLPIHVVVVELMGRNAGWLTAAAALARDENLLAPHLIYLPEVVFDEEKFLDDVRDAQRTYGTGIVVAVSEGICGKDGHPVAESGLVDGFGHKVPGGTAQALSDILLQHGIRSRGEKPGLAARASGLMVSDVDRSEALESGRRSFLAANEGQTGIIIGYRRLADEPYKISYEQYDLEAVANTEKLLQPTMIAASGADVTDEFVRYARPLIGGELPRYYTIPYDRVRPEGDQG